MKKVLVTGASGFIGQHVIRPLQSRNFEVHAISSRAQPCTSQRVTWHQVDLLEAGGVQQVLDEVRPTHLLHLAWYVVPGKLVSAQENYSWVVASMDLLRRFTEQGGERATLCGSGYEYDWNYGYCSERLTPAVPNTVYGSCKQALNLMANSFALTFGISVSWARVFFLYGPYEHPDRLVSSVIRSLLKNEVAMCSHGRQIRDYMHVQDVADGLVALLDCSSEGPVNICSGQATTLREIVLTVGRILDCLELIQLGAISARANDATLVVGDNTRITTETDWVPKYDLEVGLRQTVDWWREQTGSTPNTLGCKKGESQS